MIGMMVRVIRFQSSVSLIGITGWTFRIQTVSSLLPAPKLKLFWKGTLMRSATGFCVFFANSVSLSVAAEARSTRWCSRYGGNGSQAIDSPEL